MIRFLPIALIVLVAVDLALLVGVGWVMGWAIPVALSAVTGLLGLLVMVYAERKLRVYGRTDSGNASYAEDDRIITDLVPLFAAGILMLIPGPFTDLFGITLLIPAVRRRAALTLIELVSEPR
jgi:UPF0716 protein FxsA